MQTSRGRILAIDDEPHNLTAIRRLLFDFGCEIVTAQSGEQGLAILDASPVDVVILDIIMPGMNGYEVCRRIKEAPLNAGTLVMMVSAMDKLQDRLAGYDVRADDYLTKPYAADELKAKLGILLRLKAAQDELRTLNRTLEALVDHRTKKLMATERKAVVGRMVQGMVHNLKGPLMVMLGRATLSRERAGHLLAMPGRDQAEVNELTDLVQDQTAIEEAVGKIDYMARNLMAKSRNEAIDTARDLDLNAVIRKELTFLESDLFFKHQVKKQIDLDPALPVFHGIYADFSQVIHNLVGNACDAMRHSPKKQLAVSTQTGADRLLLRFADTGDGIGPEHLEKIFEPFYTTKPSQEEAKPGEPVGTGLGLYSCCQIVTSYGGRIEVDSRPAEGTTFTIALPLDKTNGRQDDPAWNSPCNRILTAQEPAMDLAAAGSL